MKKSLLQQYKEEVVPALAKDLNLKNPHAIPRITAVRLNVGIGSYVTAGKDHEDIVKSVTIISGQKPIVPHSK